VEASYGDGSDEATPSRLLGWSVHSCRSGTQGYKEPDGYFCITYDIKTYKVKRQH
jgi:hypothetical protein